MRSKRCSSCSLAPSCRWIRAGGCRVCRITQPLQGIDHDTPGGHRLLSHLFFLRPSYFLQSWIKQKLEACHSMLPASNQPTRHCLSVIVLRMDKTVRIAVPTIAMTRTARPKMQAKPAARIHPSFTKRSSTLYSTRLSTFSNL